MLLYFSIMPLISRSPPSPSSCLLYFAQQPDAHTTMSCCCFILQDEFKDPITYEIITDPVVLCATGQVRNCTASCLSANGQCIAAVAWCQHDIKIC